MKRLARLLPQLLLLLIICLATLGRCAGDMHFERLDTPRQAGPTTAAPVAVDPRAPRWVVALYDDADTARRVAEPLLPPSGGGGGGGALAAPARHVLMTDARGRRFNCTVPNGPAPGVGGPAAEAAGAGGLKTAGDGDGKGAAAAADASSPSPSELLEALAGVCLYHTEPGGWTYEVCHRRHVRQLLGSGAAGGSEDFICGRYGGAGGAGGGGGTRGGRGSSSSWPPPPDHPSLFLDEEEEEKEEAAQQDEGGGGGGGAEEEPSSASAAASASAASAAAPAESARDRDEARVRRDRRGVGGSGLAPDTPFLRHVYGAGAPCALGSGQPRTAEVRYVCSDVAAAALGGGAASLGGAAAAAAAWIEAARKPTLLSVREFPSCHYVATVATPALCAHPVFEARPEDARLVACAPIDGEEEEERAAAASAAKAAAADGGSTGAATAEVEEAAPGEQRQQGEDEEDQQQQQQDKEEEHEREPKDEL